MRRTIQNRKKPAPEGTSPLDAALKFLGPRARTSREVERKLDELEYGEVEIMEAVQRLTALGLLDDRAYAREFIATRLATKPVSRAHLAHQLAQHELPRALIDEALAEAIDGDAELTAAADVANKFLRQFAALPEETRRERTLQRLLARGYEYDTARAALETALSTDETEA